MVPRATSKIDLPLSTIIRKQDTGRADLFTSSTDVDFSNVRCTSSINRATDSSREFHVPSCAARNGGQWGQPTATWCWHCCHGFECAPFAAPKSYDTRERKFVVYGDKPSFRRLHRLP